MFPTKNTQHQLPSCIQLPSISQHEVLYLGTVELLICGSCAVTAAAMYQRNSYQMLGADWWSPMDVVLGIKLNPSGQSNQKTIWKTITLVNGEDSTGNWNMVFIIFHIFFASANPRMEHPENAPEKRYVKAGINVMQRETFAVLDLTCFDEPVFIPTKKASKGVVRTMAVLHPEPSFWILI